MDPLIMVHARKLKGLTQKQLASIMGVQICAVSSWERGVNRLKKIHELALRAAVGDETFYLAANRAKKGTAPDAVVKNWGR